MKTEHTPTPWSLERDGSLVMGNQVVATNIGKDSSSHEERKANAAHIVRCVNSHDALRAALELFMTECSRASANQLQPRKLYLNAAMQAAKEALALAKGGAE